jgi:YfiR/HmsC-like
LTGACRLCKDIEMDSYLQTKAKQRGNWRRIASYLLSLVVGGLCFAPVRGDPTTPSEYEVKAAFIYNFAKYVSWPEASTSEKKKPFVIGVIGKDPFGQALDAAMRGRSVEGRAVFVERYGKVEEVADCDILFISSSEKNNLHRILEALHKAPVLTVGDMDQFAERGGMINLTTEEKRVRFEINVEAAERAGLKPGSQLLRLARIVGDPRTGR